MSRAGALRLVTAALAEGGVPLSEEELLDALWLARRLPVDASAPLVRALGGVHGPARAEGDPPPDAREAAAPPEAPPAVADRVAPPGPPPAPPQGPGQEVPQPQAPQPAALHAAAGRSPAGPAAPVRPVRAPTPRASRFGQLQLGRSLRPLKLRVHDPREAELDETATAEATAESGLPDAVLRPSQARWLDVTLLVDDGTSMLLWQHLAAEVKSLLERSGAFRTVRVLGLDTRGAHAPRLARRPFLVGTADLPPSTVTDTTGRTLVLVVSDGVGAAWRDGRMREQLRQWGRHGPTAVLHALPRPLWDGSGLRAARWRVTTRRRGAPNLEWEVADPVLPPELAAFDGVPVPVLAPDPEALGTWTSVVASPGTSAVLPLLADPPAVRRADVPAGPAQAVLRFRETASPEAYRLAAHLAAVAPVSVPVMRLVQQVLGPGFDTGHLAEVFLGGLMRPAREQRSPLVPRHRRYDFCDEARDILLGTVPAPELLRSGRAVTDRLARLAGRSPDFPAWLAHPDGADRAVPEAEPFGWADRRLLRRLGVREEDLAAPAPDRARPRSRPAAQEPAQEAGGPGGRNAAAPQGADSAPPAGGPASEEPMPAYVDAPGSSWLSLGAADPRQVGRWRLFARHEPATAVEALYLGRDDKGRTAVVRLTAPERLASVVREADALHGLKAKGAPALLDSGDSWTATELLLVDADPPYPVPSLAQRVQRLGTVGDEELVHIARHTAGVLAHAHARGIVHGSLTAQRILPLREEVCLTGWCVDRDAADSHDDVGDLASLLLRAAPRGPGPALRRVLERCRGPVLADRPTAAHLALFLGELARRGSPAMRAAVPVGVDDNGRKVVLDLERMGPHGSVQGPFAARAALLYTVVNGMARRVYAPGEVRFVLVGDARLYLQPAAARDLRQVVLQSDTADVEEALGGELRRRAILLEEARAAGVDRPSLGPVVVVTEALAPETVLAWQRALRPELGIHLLVLEGAADPVAGLGFRIVLDQHGAGFLTHGDGSPDRTPLRRLLALPRLDPAAKLTDEQRHAVHIGRSGFPREALTALRAIAAEQGDLLGHDHPDTLTSHYEMGALALEQQQYAEALGIFEDTAARRTARLGPGHPDTLVTHQQRAYTLNRLGHHEEAHAVYSEVLAGWRATVGDQHPSTLLARHNLAVTLIALDRYEEAVPQARTAHEGRVKVLGDGHPSTMASAHELVIALCGSGQERLGRSLARTLYHQRVRMLGAEHEDTLATRRLLDESFPAD
ncbi:SAV_2336 N-terminal domain-related protein [Streptomyces sp. enrichment culture]|uniref:SAV_2336 N-terminal domain-related protein n=1 Tax=Streptomyces sp. enrichment culture TaxID=1795815 RepID=UPI003F56DBEC